MRLDCPHCKNRGLICVRYRNGDMEDIAICDCIAGQVWRYKGELEIRRRLSLKATQQVGYREAFDGETATPPVAANAFVAAGKTAKRAKL